MARIVIFPRDARKPALCH